MDKKRLILWIAVILTLAFIFSQSLLNQKISNKESKIVKETIVRPVHEAVTGSKKVPFDVRDVAHIVEFTVLGFELVLLFKNRNRILHTVRSVSYCGMVALIDESIQDFSGRAPQVVDIWYDILGAVVGVGIGGLLAVIIGNTKSKNKLNMGKVIK